MTSATTNDTSKTVARAVGALFLLATGAYIFGGGLVDSVLNAPDFLLQAHANHTQIVTGVMLQFVTAAANVLIGILMFGILRRYSESIALGYVVTRIFDGIGVLLAGIGSLSLIALGGQAAQAGGSDASSLQALGTLVMTHSGLTFDITMIALAVGGMPFCYLLYRVRLIPRPLAALGFIGYLSLFGGGVVELFGYDLAMVQYIPGGIFEAALPFWLFFKGFNSVAASPESVPNRAERTGVLNTA